MVCESWGCAWGGQGCFPPGVGGQQFWGGPGGLIPSCAELLADLKVPGCGIHAGHSAGCHQWSCVTSLRLSSCAEPCSGSCVTSLDTVTRRSLLWGQVLWQEGTTPADLVWPLVSRACGTTLKALLMPCVHRALGCDLVVPTPCVLLPGGWGPWWGQQGLCLEGETPTTARDCHQK